MELARSPLPSTAIQRGLDVKTKKITGISVAVLLGILAIGARHETLWTTFLSNPDEMHFAALEQAIVPDAAKCRWGAPHNRDVVPVEAQQEQLFDLIRAGNVSAFRAGLLIEKCWDGGNLEDFYRSAGLFFQAQPRDFLQIAKENAIPDSTLESLVTTLPLDTIDDIDRKIDVVDARINMIAKVDENSLEIVKTKALCFLNEYKKDLKKTRAEIEGSRIK